MPTPDAGQTVLVVEDEPNIRDLVCLHLGIEGFTCVPVGTGPDAVAAANTRAFALVILDVMLPGLDGVSVCRAIRRGTVNPDVPILMLTARREESDKVVGLDSGADDYLVKPFAFAELLARIRAVGRRGREAEAPKLAVGDLTMDLIARKVTRAGQAIELTVREFELLEFLLRYQGQVVSRETLARDVWKETSRTTPLDNVIDVHIARLRRKVDHEHAVKLIHTVRGVGFMIREGEP